MKDFNTYIVEKLKINKETKVPKFDSFFIIFSKDNKISVRNFATLDDAIDFSKKEFYLDGYAYRFKEGEIFKKINKLIHINYNYKKLEEYLTELKSKGEIINIFKYEELCKK